MKKRYRLAGVLVAAALGTGGCDPCEDTMRGEVPSPDGHYVAALFETNCGATTDYVTQVGLRGRRESFEHRQSIFVMDYRPRIKLTWQSSSKLLIEYSGCMNESGTFRIKESKERWNDILIEHHEGTPIAASDPDCKGHVAGR